MSYVNMNLWIINEYIVTYLVCQQSILYLAIRFSVDSCILLVTETWCWHTQFKGEKGVFWVFFFFCCRGSNSQPHVWQAGTHAAEINPQLQKSLFLLKDSEGSVHGGLAPRQKWQGEKTRQKKATNGSKEGKRERETVLRNIPFPGYVPGDPHPPTCPIL